MSLDIRIMASKSYFKRLIMNDGGLHEDKMQQ